MCQLKLFITITINNQGELNNYLIGVNKICKVNKVRFFTVSVITVDGGRIRKLSQSVCNELLSQ